MNELFAIIKYIMNNGENPFILLPSIKETPFGENRTEGTVKGHYRSESHMIKSKGTMGNGVSIRNHSQEAIPCLAKYVGEYRFPSRYKNHEESKRKHQPNIKKRQANIRNSNECILPSKMTQKSSISTRPKLQTQFMTIDDYHFSSRSIINTRKTEQQLKCRIKSKILKFKSLLKVEQTKIKEQKDDDKLANIVNVKCFDSASTAYQTQISKSHLRLKRQQRKPPIFRLYRNTDGNQPKQQKYASIQGWNFQKDDFQ